MPFEKLTAAQLNAASGTTGAKPEYVAFLKSLKVGEGGRSTVKAEGATRHTVKNRMKKAADTAGVTIKFSRSSADLVVFEITGHSS